MDVSRKANRMPPSAAMAEANEKANSLAAITSIPRAAAARSLVRTAMSRRPLRPRRTFDTAHTANRARPSTKRPYRSGYRIDPRSKPNRSGLPTWVPCTPPVYSRLRNSINSMVVPSPSVTMARLMPRVRTAGRANTNPRGTAAATPANNANRKGMSWTATSRPAT